ncbi:THAP domain-containing protein 10 [Holothuria leucospilota]|uniref:THAP domain-containing protein 10 n=1 Tax=Holothuria leucospilota TaxID=206669 RepID=A0A9Q0YB70_HOLLE|nr:THAP domain-containing protein 10 [Holothuria leucospilota]
MGKFCVAGYCSNSSKDGVSLHRFPKTEPHRTLWTRAVRNTRKDWLRPTNHSFLCSAHFTEDRFLELIGKRFQDFGLSPQKLRRLKPQMQFQQCLGSRKASQFQRRNLQRQVKGFKLELVHRNLAHLPRHRVRQEDVIGLLINLRRRLRSYGKVP